MPFTLFSTSPSGRRGRLKVSHGIIETPFFFPVATAGAMKGIGHQELQDLGAQALLCNTYHLHLRPGEDVVADAGGLHQFIGWEKPILTDSGGVQIFSLRNIRSLHDDGVTFRSHLDGTEHVLGPKEAMEIQHKLCADIIMVLDECPPSTADRCEIEKAVERRTIKKFDKIAKDKGIAKYFEGLQPEIKLKSEEYNVCGVLDLVNEDNGYIVEYKTSSKDIIKQEYKLQLGIYALLFLENLKRLP